jgi:transcriptional regulator with XRE-family HTH domain
MATNLPSALELARRRRGLTQVALASRAGVSRALIALCEHDYRPSRDSQRRIAAALDVDPQTLWPVEQVAV